MKGTFYTITLFFCMLAFTAASQNAVKDTIQKYVKTHYGYVMVLSQGDHFFSELEKLAKAENIPFAYFSGFGFVNVKFGFFQARKKKYKMKSFSNVELASMNGSVAWQDGKVSIHAHGVTGNSCFRSRAGHLLDMEVSTGSLEVFITVTDQKIERIKDPKLGANVLKIK